ncbi:hypothetical protein CFIMG_003282RAa, partial [Ceratocystis fimbriata CBS 114723]
MHSLLCALRSMEADQPGGAADTGSQADTSKCPFLIIPSPKGSSTGTISPRN